MKNKHMMGSIILAAVIISSSLFFYGFQIQKGSEIDEVWLSGKIDEGIENYIKKQQEEQMKGQEDQQKKRSEQAKDVKPLSEGDHVRGNKDAVVTLIEYSDYDCPYCGRFHATAKEVVEAYDGKVNWVYRHFPLPGHNPSATQKAIAVECANELSGSKAFWEMSDILYEEMPAVEELKAIAKRVGLSEAKFDTCMKSGKYESKVQEQMQGGAAVGVSGTPGNILRNNETGEVSVIPGALPFDSVKSLIDPML